MEVSFLMKKKEKIKFEVPFREDLNFLVCFETEIA